MSTRIRQVPEIGMFAFSRGMSTCLWKTPWCEKNCYALKFYRMGWSKAEYDKLDNDFWLETQPVDFAAAVNKAAGNVSVKRFRFSIKGEIWTGEKDVAKVSGIMYLMPDTLFWIPTRAWHNGNMAEAIERLVFQRPNARVLASVDPNTTPDEFMWLKYRGWQTVFSGDNEDSRQLMLVPGGTQEKITVGMHKCEKTWNERGGHCAVCARGCFSSKKDVRVHLKQHR